MIEALKDDKIIEKVGGRFKLTTLLQKRWAELLQGMRLGVKRGGEMTDLEAIVQEVVDEKLAIDYENSDIPRPEELK